MDGNATLTTVASTNVIARAVRQPARARQRRGSGGAAPVTIPTIIPA